MREELENLLLNDFNPDFLAYEFLDSKTINLVLSSKCFINQPMPERIKSVYDCIQNKLPAFLDEYVLYVNAFTESEINELREFYETSEA